MCNSGVSILNVSEDVMRPALPYIQKNEQTLAEDKKLYMVLHPQTLQRQYVQKLQIVSHNPECLNTFLEFGFYSHFQQVGNFKGRMFDEKQGKLDRSQNKEKYEKKEKCDSQDTLGCNIALCCCLSIFMTFTTTY